MPMNNNAVQEGIHFANFLSFGLIFRFTSLNSMKIHFFLSPSQQQDKELAVQEDMITN